MGIVRRELLVLSVVPSARCATGRCDAVSASKPSFYINSIARLCPSIVATAGQPQDMAVFC